MNKTIHFLCLLEQCLKDNNKTAHWVGHSQLKFLDTDDFSRVTPVVDDIQDIITDNKIDLSTSVRKNNPYLSLKTNKNKLNRLMIMMM